MKTIGIIYEITGNPYFNEGINLHDKISEYTYPSEVNDICWAFKAIGYQFEIIDGASDLFEREYQLRSICDIFFNKSIGFKGLERKSVVPVLGQFFNLPIIGSSAYSMTLARHKFHTNRLLCGMGFLTPNAQVATDSGVVPEIKIFPVIVKPNSESDSLGIEEDSVCYYQQDVNRKVKQILKTFGSPVIIEQFIPGEEIKVSVLGHNTQARAIGAVRVLKHGISIEGSLQTRMDVLSDCIQYVEMKDSLLKQDVLSMAARIHVALELSDYSRIDFRLGKKDQIYCMEVSTHPDIAKEKSSFVNAALQSFCGYEAVIAAIVDYGRKRLGI